MPSSSALLIHISGHDRPGVTFGLTSILARHGVRVPPEAVQRAEWQARVRLDDELFARIAGASTETADAGNRYTRFVLEALGVADGKTIEEVTAWRRAYNPPVGVFTSRDPQAPEMIALALSTLEATLAPAGSSISRQATPRAEPRVGNTHQPTRAATILRRSSPPHRST